MGVESLCFLHGLLSFGLILAESHTKLRNQFLLVGINRGFDCHPVSQGLIGLFSEVGNVWGDIAAGPQGFDCRGVGYRDLLWGGVIHFAFIWVTPLGRMYPPVWGNLLVWLVEV